MRCFMIVTVRNGGIDMRIITISREFGSGGRTIGKQTAEMLGIRYYDKELVKEVAVQTGFEESFVEEEGEHAPAKNWISYALAINGRNGGGMSANDFLWSIQRKVILEIAEQEPCVIVGRCADYILRERSDCLHVFIHADIQERANRIVRLYGMTAKEPEKRLEEKDKRRKLYYKHHTGQDWGLSQNYHISLDSGVVGIDKCCEIITDLYRKLK